MSKKVLGKVVKISGNKTVKVQVDRHAMHPIYGKKIKITKNFLVHDELMTSNVGDTVQIVESIPVSRHKKWKIA